MNDNSPKRKIKRKQYEADLRRLQAELCKLQEWLKHKGLRRDNRVRGPRCGWQRRND